MEQIIVSGGGKASLDALRVRLHMARPFLVCGGSFDALPARAWLPADTPRFSAFTPNPDIAAARAGALAFAASRCDSLIAVGGGSAMDTAKCVKLFSGVEAPLVCAPTTAGTGSESTRFAVVYEQGVKRSVEDIRIRPDAALLDAALLTTLPPYQKKCALADALCQAIESWWAMRATKESRRLAKTAALGIPPLIDAYLQNDPAASQGMLEMANLAGQAIDITRTTAAHAMSYKLGALYRLPHGHAVAACIVPLWRRMLTHPEEGRDARGREYQEAVFADIARATGGPDALGALFTRLGLTPPAIAPGDVDALVAAVNPERLSNNPSALDESALRALYCEIGGIPCP